MIYLILLILITGCTNHCLNPQYGQRNNEHFAVAQFDGTTKYLIQDRVYHGCMITTINSVEVNKEIWEK